jgi:Xaa-Pro aminopeptidase
MTATAATDLGAELRARLADAFARTPWDGLLAASPANVAYATSYRSIPGDLFRAHQMAALLGRDRTLLVTPAADSAPAIDAGTDPGDLVTFGRFYFESSGAQAGTAQAGASADEHGSFLAALSDAVGRLRLEATTIGVDVAGLGVHWPAVQAALRGAALVDATDWFHGVRAVKLPGEVELLRSAARLAEEGIDRAMAAAAPGVTELELATVVARRMVEGGGSPRFMVVAAGTRSALGDAPATDYALRPGDLVRFDVGCVVDGYWSDTARTAVVGEPTRLQRQRYGALLAGEEAQLRILRPGVETARLYEVAIDTVERAGAGINPYRRHHCGHGIGSEVYEPPIVRPGDETRLEVGMTINVETPYYELGWGGMMVEDTVVLTEDGHERLTTSDRALRVIPA